MQNSIKTFFRVGAEDFKKIPGSPIAYWLSKNALTTWRTFGTVGEFACPGKGLFTGDNLRFLRFHWEISKNNVCTDCNSHQTSAKKEERWYPHRKGGEFRRWFGNEEYVINFQYDGRELRAFQGYGERNPQFYFKEALTWTKVTSASFSSRYSSAGALFDDASCVCVPKENCDIYGLLGFLNSCVANYFLRAISPTINYSPGEVHKLPFFNGNHGLSSVNSLLSCSKSDWDSYETSWDFQSSPLLEANKRCCTPGMIDTAYLQLREEWRMSCEAMRKLEVENNRIFIDAYGLQAELSPEVPWNEITLTCNPWYRYGKAPTLTEDGQGIVDSENCHVGDVWSVGQQGTTHVSLPNGNIPANKFPFNQDLEQRLLEDTIKEFISYAVGCMMGRYSPEKPGLILANQGDGTDDYFRIMGDRDAHIAAGERFAETTSCLVDEPYSQMKCCGTTYHHVMDSDGVIPILDDEWFMDDIVAQFKAFLTFTFGEENFTQNLQFIEGALGKDLRKYFIKDFYKEHVQRYKKRPIYWLFSSPNGSFNALIYMHRYRPDTVSIVLNDYLREYMTKLGARREHLIAENNRADLSSAARTRNLKLIDKYASMLAELEAYERDILFPLAQKKIAIDLDDGVKVNYCKFGDALKKIPGLAAKEE